MTPTRADPLTLWADEISSVVRSATAIAVGILSNEGVLLYASSGLKHLLRGDEQHPGNLEYLINPPLSQFLQPGQSDGVLYSGWFTFSTFMSQYRSVRGEIRKKGDQLLLMAQYDVDELVRTTQDLIELNGEITSLQRDLALANLKQKQTLEILGAEEERYRSVVEDQTELICRFRPNGQPSFVNRAYSRFTGKSAEEILTAPADAPPPLLTTPDQYAENLSKLTPDNPVTSYEHQVTDANGTLRYLQWTCRAFFNARGKAVEYQAVGRDLTGQKAAEAQRKELELERERGTLLSNFVRDISHDLNTPLTILSTALYLLPKIKDPASQKERIASMEQQVERLKTLIAQAMTMSRLDSGSMQFAPVNIHELVTVAAESAKPTATRRGLQIATHLATSPISVEGDQAQLTQALASIVDNALKFTPAGGSITLRAHADSEATIEIEDTGIGIAADDIPHIFERFYRGDKARSEETGGAGLGLPIARRIVELHHGRIDVTSTLGNGSVFRITLPVKQPNPVMRERSSAIHS